MGRTLLSSSDYHDPPRNFSNPQTPALFSPPTSSSGGGTECDRSAHPQPPRPFSAAPPINSLLPSPHLCRSHLSRVGLPTGVSGRDARSYRLSNAVGPQDKKSMRAAANDVAVRTRARIGSAHLQTEHSLDPAIGPRDLSVVAVASRRVLAVAGSAQARNVTREKPKQGPRRQVVILGDSAPRFPSSCQQRCCSLIVRSRLP